MKVAGVFNHSPFEVFVEHFRVEENTSSIQISLTKGPFEHFFVLVKDPDKQLRALLTYKTRITQYCIGETFNSSSNNTIFAAIQPGEWQVSVVRPALIQGEFELEITPILTTAANSPGTINHDEYDVFNQSWSKLISSQAKWYPGDLHTHSYYSDGRVSLDEVTEAANRKHLSFIALTDHSIVTTHFPKTDQLVIPSMEITFDNEIHYNAHGLEALIDYAHFFSMPLSKDEILDNLFAQLTAKGVVLSINHPFAEGISRQHNFDIRFIHLLEVINAPHLLDEPIDNEKAIRFFDFLWQNGHLLFAVAGSDAHKKNYKGKGGESYPIGIPTTYIYSEGLSIDHLLQGLRQGHIMINSGVDCHLTLSHTGNMILPGTEVCGVVEINAIASQQPVVWRLIENGRCIMQQESHEFYQSIDVTAKHYYRLEARIGNRTVFFANPIYYQLEPAREFQFANLLNSFQQIDERN